MKTTTRSLLLTALICLVLARVGEAAISDFDGDRIAYWKLDVIDGSSDTPEEIGPYTTSVQSDVAVTSPGKVDDAFDFDGSSGADRVKTDGNVPVGTSFSVSVWLRLDRTPPTAYRRIVENDYSSSFYLGSDNTGKYLFIVNGDFSLVGPALVVDSINWVHVAGTYDSATTTAKLYVNNVATTASITAPGSANLDVTIGSSSTGNDTWPGDIDEVRIYNRALTAGEIDDLYNNITGAPAPTLTIADNSVNENLAAGAAAGSLTVNNTNNTFTFSLVETGSFPDNTSFTLGGGNSSNVLTAAVFDYEAQTNYSIRVLATESGGSGLELTNTFAIAVNNISETFGGVYALAEVTAGQTAVATLQSLPGDNTSMAYSKVTGFDSADFSIAGDALSLSSAGVLGDVKYIEVQAVGSPIGETNSVFVKVSVVASAATTVIYFE